ncbi:MAG: hypothetical protein LBK62_06990 [Treponema sp.]|jgi:hypothetical protein|nr:hypothetical protein [Treponema sp.]
MRETWHAAGETRDTGAKARSEEHTKFWNHEETAKPLASFRIGNYFFATHYKAARKLLVKGQKISPAMLDVDSFLEDYEEQYAAVSALNQSGFWTAEPYTGIPWMEAFWGCEIIAGEESFMARPLVTEARDLEKLQFSMDNPWVDKYFEFVTKLNKLSQGRFPIGAPIMRGQGDTAGALMGQTAFIYALYEEPEIIKKTLGKIVDSFLRIYQEMHRLNAPFLGGSSMGLYHVWAPGESLWFQDDIGALLSPPLYREFLLENEKRFCAGYRYTMMHLHPSSFHLLDAILSNQYLKAVEINKDVGGPSITQMLPQFRKVLEQGRCLIIWGDLTEAEIRIVFDHLPPRGIFFNILLPDFDQAERINAFLNVL